MDADRSRKRQSWVSSALVLAGLLLFVAGQRWLALAAMFVVALIVSNMQRERREREREERERDDEDY
ncbi:hypothetical protein [Dactylosporangium darangshiense]|uniref:Uncharacterized protein n=1 Tax=Dactylosporangium darangshiense TaxID=579108 RepID=A0ABP8DFN4_9ACTN